MKTVLICTTKQQLIFENMITKKTQSPLQKADEYIKIFGCHFKAIEACKIAKHAILALSITIDKKLKAEGIDKYYETMDEYANADMYWDNVIEHIEERKHIIGK